MFEKVDDIYFLIFVIMLIDNIVGKHEHHSLLEHKSIPILMRLHKTKKYNLKQVINKHNNRLQIVNTKLKLTIKPIQLQNKHKIKPKFTSFNNKSFILMNRTRIF